jgi:adenosyl cobinamide kinase/adenosyl cobinamide phosphate guanylyltransferase
VSNEAGLGVVPPNELGRDFRDVLGRVNAAWAARAAASYFVVAGRVVSLEEPAIEEGEER